MKHLGSILALSLFATAGPAVAQQSIEVYGGVGFTSTDAESWAGSTLMDWNETMSGAHAQLYLLGYDRIRVGVEVGYQYLLWYQFRFSGFPVERNVDAYRAMAVVRSSFTPALFGEVAAGFYAFEDFADPAIGAAVGGRIALSERWTIPVKLRVNTIFDADANMVPIGLSVGAAYEFGAGSPARE